MEDKLNCRMIVSNQKKVWVNSEPKADQYDSQQLKSIQISVDDDRPMQVVSAFGACFNELGFEAYSLLDQDDQKNVMRALFDAQDGARFNYCRVPIGANDFSTSWYSHNESRDDYEMENFSIMRDFKSIIPFILAAKEINPDLRLWASPWCPPSWMKKSGNYASSSVNSNWGQILGSSNKDLKMDSRIRDEPEVLAAYALYFVKFIEAYEKVGIAIEAVHPQNETFAAQIFPSCLWDREIFVRFISDYLHPAFSKAGLSTEIWAGTFNGDDLDYADWIVNNPKLAGLITGGGFQWHAKEYLHLLKRPEQFQIMQTESECHNGSNDWDTAFTTFNLLCKYFASGTHAYMYWNIALDQYGLSNWGWRQNSLVTIDNHTNQFKLNPDYYAMKHFSAKVDIGAQYLKSTCEGDSVPFAAFKNPSGEYVILAANEADEPVSIRVLYRTQANLQFVIPACSIVTAIVGKDLKT